MEKSRKQKLLVIVALIVGIVSLSVGFAAFSTTLNISSSASVSPSSDTFSVKFSTSKDSLVVGDVAPSSKTSGITATNGIINNSGNPTITNLSATFTEPGQYVEYTFYARNEGEYTAYLNSINFIGTNTCEASDDATAALVEDACSSIYTIVYIGDNQDVYSSTSEISHHALNKQTGEKISLRIEYAYDGARADGPFNISLQDVKFIYSTIDDPTYVPETVVKLVSGNLNDPGSIVAIGDEQFYVIGQEDRNVKLLSMYNLYVGIQYDEDNGPVTISDSPGIQHSKAIGYFDEFSAENPIIGVTEFSSNSQKGTNYSDYSGSIVEGYVNNYASYLEGLGANIEEARLITKEELETLGCSSDNHTCSGAPEFVYKTSYWTGSAYSADGVWTVEINGGFGYWIYVYNYEHGVRPVIEIPLSEF